MKMDKTAEEAKIRENLDHLKFILVHRYHEDEFVRLVEGVLKEKELIICIFCLLVYAYQNSQIANDSVSTDIPEEVMKGWRTSAMAAPSTIKGVVVMLTNEIRKNRQTIESLMEALTATGARND